MATIFKSFILSAIALFILSFFLDSRSIWYYFIPLTLFVVVAFLIHAKYINKLYSENILLKNPSLLDSVESEIFVKASSIFIPIFRPMLEPQRLDKASAVGGISWIGIPYCIYLITQSEWLVLIITVIPFLYIYLGSSLSYCFYSGNATLDSEAIFKIVNTNNSSFLNVDVLMAEYYYKSIIDKIIPK